MAKQKRCKHDKLLQVSTITYRSYNHLNPNKNVVVSVRVTCRYCGVTDQGDVLLTEFSKKGPKL